MNRLWLCVPALVLAALAFLRTAPLPAGQAAVPLSLPGQENISFWVDHRGMEQIDVTGPAGFGDMARILLRRRSNTTLIQKLRDRFTFKIQDLAALDTPDLFRAELSGGKLVWRNRPERFVIGADHTFNLPLIVKNLDGAAATVQARFDATTSNDVLPASQIAGNGTGAYFLRVVESEPGARAGKLTVKSGASELTAAISFDVRARATLKVRLVDETNRPVAARVYLTGSDGLSYAPRGTVNRIAAMSADYFFHAEDSFEIEMPSGETAIEAGRGTEYRLAKQVVTLAPGKPHDVTLRLARWENMAAKGWYSSDAHIHANYTSHHHQVITAKDMRLQTIAEDLNNANLMVANSSGAFLHDAQYFEGKPSALSSPNYILYWNEEFRNQGTYGHMSFYGLKNIVYPAFTGFKDTPHWEDYPSNYTQAAAAQKQGGAVTYVHPTNDPTFETSSARELPVDLALGQVDAMDVLSNNDEMASMAIWYRLLNCGFRLAISAGTDSFTNVADHYIAGGGRVYVHSGFPLRYDEWVKNYKRGRSFSSNGPVVFFTVNGKEPGEEIRLPEGASQKVRVRATVRSAVPLDKFEIVVNGEAVVSKPMAGKEELTIDQDLPLPRSGWIAARATGPRHRMVLNDVQAFAHTSPVYAYLGKQPIVSVSDAKFYREWIEKLIERVNRGQRFATPERKKEVLDIFQRGLEIYRKLEQS